MIQIDVTDIVKGTKLMNPKLDFDTCYTFYYDETNNIKKFRVRENGFNNSFNSNFVLGGVLHEGDKPDIQELFDNLRLQQNIGEIKVKHFAEGDFLNFLSSRRYNSLFKYLLDSPLYVHYSSVDVLYFSLVDIVDSAILNFDDDTGRIYMFAPTLKNDLYKICKLKIQEVAKIFYDFQYPNIKKENIKSFIDALIFLFEDHISNPDFHFGLTTLKHLLKTSINNGSLPFVMDEEDYLLLKDFFHHYLDPIYTFKNSKHIFDNEDDIKSIIQDYEILLEGTKIGDFRFEDSKNQPLIQISDVFVGFLGKLSFFINGYSESDIADAINGSTYLQKETLDLFLEVINKSEKKNKAFLHNVQSYESTMKFKSIYKVRNKVFG